MSTRSKIEKWILADWTTGHNNPGAAINEDMKVVVNLQQNQENQMEEIDHERPLLEQQQCIIKNNKSDLREEEDDNPRDGRDYSPSVSSWAPTDGSSSDDSDREDRRSKSMRNEYARHYAKKRNSKKVLTPMHRPNAVVKVLQERRINNGNNSMNESRKRKYKENPARKSLPDSTRKNIPLNEIPGDVNMKIKVIMDIKDNFDEIFKIIYDLKKESVKCTSKYFSSDTTLVPPEENTVNFQYNTHVEEESESEQSNRSDDNVLISNKYKKARVSKKQPPSVPEEQKEVENGGEDEWIPIGSGKTLIHKEKFRKVNWKSYTMATRTLLCATFPRRILATHSLTGKRSPAFQNKPAKMCLDPKIVSDIIIEITSKFDVKENLVRSAITTKLADECKMFKMRIRNKDTSRRKREAPSENQPSAKSIKTE